MEDAGANQPAGAGFEPICFGKIKDAVVAFIPVLKAPPNLPFGCAWFETEERVRKVVADIVVLRRVIIGLRLPLQANQFGLFGILMHVVRNGSHVVEELRIDRPLFVFVPNFFADEQ